MLWRVSSVCGLYYVIYICTVIVMILCYTVKTRGPEVKRSSLSTVKKRCVVFCWICVTKSTNSINSLEFSEHSENVQRFDWMDSLW